MSNWVEELTGFKESLLLEKIKQRELKINNQLAGEFKILNFNDFNLQINGFCKFIIYTRSRGIKWVDVSSLQTILESDKNVMFQVASNFNCQENSSDQTNLFSSHYLTNLMTDKTQGPSAAAGAAWGSILRLAIHYHDPINLLSRSEVQIKNGKVISVKSIKKEEIQIGLHSNVVAIFDRSEGCLMISPKKRKKIDQVFVSTMCLKPKEKNNWVTIFLTAAYEGTYGAANLRGTKKLVLTLIGGGAFNNPIELIAKIIAETHAKFSGNLEEVILPLWDDKLNPNLFIKELKRAGVREDFIQVI